MKASFSFLIAIPLLLQSCATVVQNRTPDTSKASPAAVLTPIPTNLATTDLLTQIPMQVGYGVRGNWFELYFTDPTNRAAKQLTGGIDGPLAAAIDSSRLTVDAALYSLSLRSIRNALMRANQRGVQVRLVMETDNMDSSVPQALQKAGISIIGDGLPGLMHDKFIIIDRSEVWTGSMNSTNEGAYADNNNLMQIHSAQVAQDYENEFNEMFVEHKFGPTAQAITPYPRVTIDGTPLDIYFSPHDHVQVALVDLLDSSQSCINFLAFSFTSDSLGKSIRNRAAAGVKVAGVMETDEVASNIGTEFDSFRAAGLDVRLDGSPGQMHHKVMIIDDRIVVMGSYNYTASAEQINDENVIVIYNSEIASEYTKEFQRIYALAQP